MTSRTGNDAAASFRIGSLVARRQLFIRAERGALQVPHRGVLFRRFGLRDAGVYAVSALIPRYSRSSSVELGLHEDEEVRVDDNQLSVAVVENQRLQLVLELDRSDPIECLQDIVLLECLS